MKVLITGVCGFVGSSLAQCLIQSTEGVSIVGIDNLMRPGSESNRAKLRKSGVYLVHGDIRCASDFESLPGVDWVVDAAANPSVLAGTQSGFSGRQLFEHNLASLINVLEFCKAKRSGLILLSTSRVYSIPALTSLPLTIQGDRFCLDSTLQLPGGVSEQGISPDFSTTPPISLYGSTKLASEVVALEYGLAFDFPVWINRCGVMAGAGQFGTPEQGIFSYWINAHRRRLPLRFIGCGGTGRQVRDALHPADLADLLCLQFRCSTVRHQRIYTVGGGPRNSMSLAELTTWCNDRFGSHQPVPDPCPRPYDIPWMIMDNTAIQRDFGWCAELSMEQILCQIAQHAQENPDWLDRSGL